jgi:integrase/recombinase XerD
MKNGTRFGALLGSFFHEYLTQQRQVSPNTIASYRDTFCLLLKYCDQRLKRSPSELELEDLDAALIGAFLHHLEQDRGVCARTRNQRLAAIRSFFRYVAFRAPEEAGRSSQILALPSKRFDRATIDYLTRPEIEAMLQAPDRTTWGGRRDHALMMIAILTGLRASEMVGLRCQDVTLGTGAHVRCSGKGRKARCTPIAKQGRAVLKSWLGERGGNPSDVLFPNAKGGALSRHGLQHILSKHAEKARLRCPSLRSKRVSPHVLRHTTAMSLLEGGADSMMIALMLGHESVGTTQVYIKADLKAKERILAKAGWPDSHPARFRASDRLLTMLGAL